MKHLFILLILSLSTTCFSQIEKKSLIGVWEFENMTDYDGVIVEHPVRQFDFIIRRNGDFDMKGDEYSISGTWKLSNSILTIVGTRDDRENIKTKKMEIHLVNKDKLSFTWKVKNQKKILMNLKRVK